MFLENQRRSSAEKEALERKLVALEFKCNKKEQILKEKVGTIQQLMKQLHEKEKEVILLQEREHLSESYDDESFVLRGEV